jgi:hypothetical protein
MAAPIQECQYGKPGRPNSEPGRAGACPFCFSRRLRRGKPCLYMKFKTPSMGGTSAANIFPD